MVPLIYKTQVIGALNILSHQRDTFDDSDIPLLRQFAAHVAVALENSRLFERERENSDVFETLAEIGQQLAAILDLDELLTRTAQLIKRVIDYRTFGISLLNEKTSTLELNIAVHYGEAVQKTRLKLGEGLSATRRCTRCR